MTAPHSQDTPPGGDTARSRDAAPSRAAVPVVTATWNVSLPLAWVVATVGIEPAVSTDRSARPLR